MYGDEVVLVTYEMLHGLLMGFSTLWVAVAMVLLVYASIDICKYRLMSVRVALMMLISTGLWFLISMGLWLWG